MKPKLNWGLIGLGLSTLIVASHAFGASAPSQPFPLPLDSYGDASLSMLEQIKLRAAKDPFNVVAFLIFSLAIIHTFFAAKFNEIAHKIQHDHIEKRIKEGTAGKEHQDVSFLGQLFHFLGEVEAIFGIYAIALVAAATLMKGWGTVTHYLGHTVNYTEPMFVVVIMAIAATRPILNASEDALKLVAKFGNETTGAWWLSILIIAPILGSFITEPAAMTIAALLLGKQFYRLKPSNKFKYGTLGLLFVNISVGGTLTNFAAPPVLMVAAPWKWSTMYMMENFGWKAIIGIIISTLIFYVFFKSEFKQLDTYKKEHKQGDEELTSDDHTDLVPAWITAVHMLFMFWTVFNAHYPALFIGGFLIFLGFMEMTPQHQNRMDIKSPMLVGFFLAGLVTHGGLQGWWIAPLLGSFSEVPLMIVSTVMTTFNDNAAITYLSTLVPNFSPELKYAVVAGAVTGGGVTVIANAPNPAGQSILSRFFPKKMISPLYLAVSALIPTIIMGLCFMLL